MGLPHSERSAMYVYWQPFRQCMITSRLRRDRNATAYSALCNKQYHTQ